jgi:hypothetical protein
MPYRHDSKGSNARYRPCGERGRKSASGREPESLVIDAVQK